MSEKAVLISGESYTEPAFQFGYQTSVYGSCSLTLKNSLYVFGGIDKKQVSQLNGNRLERIGNLDFEFYHGACANLNNEYFYLCFSNDELQQCRFSLGAKKEFHKITESSDRHGEISIAASTSEFSFGLSSELFLFSEYILAVGHTSLSEYAHNRAELLDTDSGTWLSVNSYPFATGLIF